MSKYEIIIGWVSGLPGGMAHGATREDARRCVQEATALWPATAREFGDPTPEPRCGPHIAARERPRGEFRDVAPPAAEPATVPAGWPE